MEPKTSQFDSLSDEAKAIYRRLKKEWHIMDSAGELTLLVAMQAVDRLREAQAIIAKDGIIQADRFGQGKPHPACQIEKEARAGLLMALKALNLDLESLESDDAAAT